MHYTDTICAIATPAGSGAIAVIRLSGTKSFDICNKVFIPATKGKIISQQKPNTVHFGTIVDKSNPIDEVLVSIFKAPHSYTGEDAIEISCHGSTYIQQNILQILINAGARMATPGEFTMRAFLSGKLDLSQAEAVADLIASQSEASRKVAMNQMRGGFSNEIKDLRKQLVDFVSLIELELDFSEEDVEFADRKKLKALIEEISLHITKLENSFKLGNVIKTGIPVSIIGKPNVGKSTLLNALLNEDKAIVSEIEGTTRDSIEDTITINGILFRFIDTAGLRQTSNTVESLGIERTYQKVEKAEIVVYMQDAASSTELQEEPELKQLFNKFPDKKWLIVLNKSDKLKVSESYTSKNQINGLKVISISAKYGKNIDKLTEALIGFINLSAVDNNEAIVTNIRHYEALKNSGEALKRVDQGLREQIPTDFVAQDIREALHYLGEITGEISTTEVLGNIFEKFCIGK